jgi:hypothetical protein
MENDSGILTLDRSIFPQQGTRDRVQEHTTWPISPHERARDSAVACSSRRRAGTIAAEPSALDSFYLGEPLLRDFDHLPEARQYVRVEDRPQRTAIARDLGL